MASLAGFSLLNLATLVGVQADAHTSGYWVLKLEALIVTKVCKRWREATDRLSESCSNINLNELAALASCGIQRAYSDEKMLSTLALLGVDHLSAMDHYARAVNISLLSRSRAQSACPAKPSKGRKVHSLSL
ncbi:hypothetical protein FIBSPDRAFT_895735 [Athelia psychrophila]|uniref:Uncharacterized protein n=1 Tax=Athelia psychrophila TaxID=1759441 RepID=A0A166EAZ7_9AGAM|nr:hypothetical protein FIBSPDRAFT_895735 [Fibularhizoctonia sp. CBS 109695]